MRHQVNLSQKHLINQLIKYVEIKQACKLTDPEKSEIMKGLCMGFSIVYSYMSATGNSQWWQGVLTTLALWDRTEESLQLQIDLPGSRDKNPSTLDHLLTRACNYIFFNQANGSIIKIDELKQHTFLKVGSLFSSELGGVHHSYSIKPISPFQMLKLLEKDITEKEQLVLICNANHACTVFYDYSKKLWIFYDPNEYSELKFNSKMEMMKKIIANLGVNLELEVATLNVDLSTFKNLKRRHQQVKDNSPVNFLELEDVYEIEKKIDPTYSLTLSGIYKNADADNALFVKIINAASHNPKLLNAFLYSLSETTPDRLPQMHVIIEKFPKLITTVLLLFKEYGGKKDMLGHFFRLLYSKNPKTNKLALELLAEKSPQSLDNIIFFLNSRPHDSVALIDFIIHNKPQLLFQNKNASLKKFLDRLINPTTKKTVAEELFLKFAAVYQSYRDLDYFRLFKSSFIESIKQQTIDPLKRIELILNKINDNPDSCKTSQNSWKYITENFKGVGGDPNINQEVINSNRAFIK